MNMVKTEKTRKTRSIDYETLPSIIALAESIIAENPELTLDSFEINLSYGYGDSVNVVMQYETLEDDDEFHKRCEQDRLYNEARRQQYEALKKEFEGGKA